MQHRRVLRAAFSRGGGVEVDTQGDAFFVAFPTARGAVEAAQDLQRELAKGSIRVSDDPCDRATLVGYFDLGTRFDVSEMLES